MACVISYNLCWHVPQLYVHHDRVCMIITVLLEQQSFVSHSVFPKKAISQLHFIQKLRCLSVQKSPRESTHTFKVLLLVYKTLRGLRPGYVSETFLIYKLGKPFRSSGSRLVTVPKCRTKISADSLFSSCAPCCRLCLLENLRVAEILTIF